MSVVSIPTSSTDYNSLAPSVDYNSVAPSVSPFSQLPIESPVLKTAKFVSEAELSALRKNVENNLCPRRIALAEEILSTADRFKTNEDFEKNIDWVQVAIVIVALSFAVLGVLGLFMLGGLMAAACAGPFWIFFCMVFTIGSTESERQRISFNEDNHRNLEDLFIDWHQNEDNQNLIQQIQWRQHKVPTEQTEACKKIVEPFLPLFRELEQNSDMRDFVLNKYLEKCFEVLKEEEKARILKEEKKARILSAEEENHLKMNFLREINDFFTTKWEESPRYSLNSVKFNQILLAELPTWVQTFHEIGAARSSLERERVPTDCMKIINMYV